MMQPIQAMEYGKTIMDDIKDIRPFLRTLIRENRITPTINTYFPIHFQKDIDVTRNGDKSCRDFCSYHSTMDIRNLNISDVPYLFYGVIPDITSAPCFNGNDNHLHERRIEPFLKQKGKLVARTMPSKTHALSHHTNSLRPSQIQWLASLITAHDILSHGIPQIKKIKTRQARLQTCVKI
ncbi:hypothetical protein BCR33DRAFT_447073 [Rhizoclosmatium globosum]|uniref:Uncharacterized protein n=1 Tax=Rhizoclosmatium globosum TaxID=329046 RepID=A0A1Y2BS40_9FUNG|nr:hypothetical protein BCR33DRAFT_447073 [Rhizoclosmatium globosum]|eukprot:ORY37581.1 hypothetical protein BCR33DRAFT_447073 [Rhizoclosmatium globosum]